MSERHFTVRSSFVNVGSKRRATHQFVLLFVPLHLRAFVSCAGKSLKRSMLRISIRRPPMWLAVYASRFSGMMMYWLNALPCISRDRLTDSDVAKMKLWGEQIKTLLFSLILFLTVLWLKRPRTTFPIKNRQYNSMRKYREFCRHFIGFSP